MMFVASSEFREKSNKHAARSDHTVPHVIPVHRPAGGGHDRKVTP
ncbi:hypothetical protein NY08_3637 [Rhodococcus sp. B7740]|nr:hypothetical protein NY08_3637 [Rhodococcus sp. B7740]